MQRSLRSRTVAWMTVGFATILVSEAARRAAGAPVEAWREVSREPLRGRRERMAYHTPAGPGPAGSGPGREDGIAFPAVERAL